MKLKTIAAIAATILAEACASEQTVTLMPRGNADQGSGKLDRMTNTLTVQVAGNTYQGRMQMQTAMTTSTALGSVNAATTSSQASALLVGPAGQMRCDFGWDALMTSATGICVDRNNATYDLLIRN